MIFEK